MNHSAKIAGLLLAMMSAAAAQQATPQSPKAVPPKTSAAAPASKTPSSAQSPAKPDASKSATHKKDNAAWHKFCAPEGDYCVKYPSDWEVLGDTQDSSGIIVAPPQSEKPAARWSSVTIAATDLPALPPDKERPSFDELIAIVLESMRPGVAPQTLERRQTTIDELPAQFLKLRYTDESGTWIETLALMDADDVIYSIALRCTPAELATLEPTFKQIVDTWKLVEQPDSP